MPVPATLAAPQRSSAGQKRPLYDFVPGRPHPELLPVKQWGRILRGCLAYGGAAGLAEPGDPCGVPALRAAIAAHLSLSRGIVADPAQVLVTSGVQEGISLVARLLLEPGARVLVENPSYDAALLALSASGARLSSLAVDEDGLVTTLLPDEAVTLAYLTPAHQYPTGSALSAARRAELIAWARRRGCYLLEDDYDGDLQYDGAPPLALAAMAPDCTLFLGTFATTLGAGLRVGYLVVPPQLVDATRAQRALSSGGVPWLEQTALAEFMQSGSFAVYLTRCRAQYKESRDALLSSLRRHFGAVELGGEAAGLHVFWRLPAGVPEAGTLEALARGQHVGIYSLASAGARELLPTELSQRGLLLGYACMSPRQIEQGVARLSDAVDDMLDDHHDFLDQLLLDEPRRHRAPLGQRRRRGFGERPRAAFRTVHGRPPGGAHHDKDMMTHPLQTTRLVRGIYRYPIKGLSPQPLRGVELEAGKPFPFDRVFALARPGVPIDPAAPRWAKKGLFLMLMLDESLARFQTWLDPETLRFTVQRESQGDRREPLLDADLGTAAGRAVVEDFFRRQVPRLQTAPTLVRAQGGHFMDKPDNVLSCINLATLRNLEAEWRTPVHPLRFRANFYIDGVQPWEELTWVGSDIQLGDVLFRVDRRNGRCGATNVNPLTGERDMDIPAALRQRFGHKDLGIYLVARTSGRVVVGDAVQVPELASSAAPSPIPLPARAHGNFICRGCYYVYEQGQRGPTGPLGPFEDVSADWRCPDCGTTPQNFRPYLPELTSLQGRLHERTLHAERLPNGEGELALEVGAPQQILE